MGSIKPHDYAVKLRFNFNEAKRECPLSEIFDIPEEENIEVPKEWLDRIQIGYSYQGFQAGVGQANSRGGFNVHNYLEDEDLVSQITGGAGYHGSIGKPVGGSSKKADASAGNRRSRRSNSSNPAGARAGVGMNQETGCIEFPTLAAARSDRPKPLDYDPTYIDLITVNHGEVIANGFDQVLAGLSDLEEMDDLLEDIYREAADRLSIQAKAAMGIPQVIPPMTDRIKRFDEDEFRASFLASYGDEVTAGFEQTIDGLNDINNCDEVLFEVIKLTIGKMSLQTQASLGVI